MTNKASIFRFADVEVREREFSLIKAGEALPVEPKAFRVLLILLRNPQKLITKEELLNAVWGDIAVGDGSLTRSIFLLRRLLGDDTHNPRFIETAATVGYRFICPVEQTEEPSVASSREQTGKKLLGWRAIWSNRIVAKFGYWLLIGAGLVIVLTPAIWYLRRPLPPPRVTDYSMITLDGLQKEVVGADGSRLYLNVVSPRGIAQAPIAGGPITRIPVDLLAADPYSDDRGGAWDLSPDGSRFLVRSHWDGTMYDMSVVGTEGHPSRYLARALSAAWSPDGKSVVYSTAHGDIYQIPSAGGEARRILPSPSPPGETLDTYDLSWSPDGSRIRFTRGNALWEVSPSGTNLRQLLPGWHSPYLKCCGRWTPDGEFFLFISGNTLQSGVLFVAGAQIWAIDERRGRLRPPIAQPIQLTSGPIDWGTPIPSRDGKRIFAQGVTPRGELVRYDRQSNHFQPYLGGISAEFVDFSKDGRYVAYVSFPDGILWRANRDGTGLMQLSEPPFHPTALRWSPNGSQILFIDNLNDVGAMFVVPAQGGTPTRVLPEDKRSEGDATWSPDGKEVVYDSRSVFSPGPRARSGSELRVLDLASHKATTIPASEGMSSPRLSPDGRYIAALTSTHGLRVFDRESQRWRTLQKAPVNWPCWSQDSRSIYFEGPDRVAAVSKIRIDGGQTESVVEATDFRFTGWYAGWMGLDPSDAPLLLRDLGTNEIYSLRLERK